MKDIARLVRLPNLAMIAFILFSIQKAVTTPIMQKYGFDIPENAWHLYLLIAATVLIAAGGYIINDYFDIKIDSINKPDKLIISRSISKPTAMLMYQIISVTGVIIGLTLSHFIKSYSLAFIFIVVPGILWFYAASYKRQFLTGNLMIAFCSALLIITVALLEIATLEKQYGNLIFSTPIPKEIYAWTGGFAVFSFISTLIRELIKDMQDIEGDCEMECRTVPIKMGIEKTKIWVNILIITTISLLLYVLYFVIPFGESINARFVWFGLILPFASLAYLVQTSKSSKAFQQAATFAKYIMLVGVLYSYVFYYIMAKTHNISIFGIFSVQ